MARGTTIGYFIAKYNPAGQVLWVRGADGDHEAEGWGIATDTAGNAYVLGKLLGNDVFGSYAVNYSTVQPNYRQVFVAKYNAAGYVGYALRLQNGAISPGGIAVDLGQHVFVTAGFGWPNLIMGPDTLLPSGDAFTFFLGKLGVLDSCATIANTITADANIICANGQANICAPAGYALYQWNNGSSGNCITVSLAGNYYVTISDANNCSAESNHFALGVYPSPTVSVSVSGDTFYAFNGSGYQWLLNGQAINGATDSVYVATGPGTYTVQVTDGNGCTGISSAIIYAGIDEVFANSILVVPNPSAGKWQIQFNIKAGAKAELFDNSGRCVYTGVLKPGMNEINYDGPAGTYMLRVLSADITTIKSWLSFKVFCASIEEKRFQLRCIAGFHAAGKYQAQFAAAHGQVELFLLFFSLGIKGRYFFRVAIAIQRYKSVERFVALIPCLRRKVFSPHFGKNFHGGVESARNCCGDCYNIA